MKRNCVSYSGFFNRRAGAALALCSVGLLLGLFSFASTPPSGTLTDTSGPLTYTAGPFFVANKTPVPEVDVGPECDNPFQPCDDYALTVTLPQGYAAAHPGASIKVTLGWADGGAGQSDYDLYIYNNPDPNCSPSDCTVTDGTQGAAFQSAGGSNPEVATISPVVDGTVNYTVKVVPYTPTGETVNVMIELLPGTGGGSSGFGGPDPTSPGVPRYQNFYAPSGSSAEPSSGEFNIGFNPISGRIMTMNTGPIWRITPPESLTPPQPECCEGLWEDVTNINTITGLDPILWTDQNTGRTFASNSTAGANALTQSLITMVIFGSQLELLRSAVAQTTKQSAQVLIQTSHPSMSQVESATPTIRSRMATPFTIVPNHGRWGLLPASAATPTVIAMDPVSWLTKATALLSAADFTVTSTSLPTERHGCR